VDPWWSVAPRRFGKDRGMGHSHDHGHGGGPVPRASRQVRIILAVALAPLIIATAVGLVALWPGETDSVITAPQFLDDSTLEEATVQRVTIESCLAGSQIAPPESPRSEGEVRPGDCATVVAHVDTGPEAGDEIELSKMALGGIAPNLGVGDVIIVSRSYIAELNHPVYNYSDQKRQSPMLLLLVIFVAAVIGIARMRGFTALIGLVVTLGILVKFVLPAILEAQDPVLVALVGASASMIVIICLTHGFNARTATALLGTLVSLALTAGLASIFVSATRITGQYEDEVVTLALAGSKISVTGLLLAGIIIGALGVLNDVTVTQASAVWELHRANPRLGGLDLYLSVMRIGRDHIASVVDTLVLAYAGASLPLLVLFAVSPRSLGAVVNGEIVAVEVVRALVGSIGLVFSVPITTALAAAVLARSRSDLGIDGDNKIEVEGESESDPAGDPAVGLASSAVATPPTLRLRIAAARARRRAQDVAEERRTKRAEAKQDRDASWQPSKSERDFWKDADG